jgi:CheY-like chemotaxis protein
MNRVLVVEDNALNRELLWQILEESYSAEFALDGEQAIQMMSERSYAAVLLDISIPKLDGHEVARTLRGMGYHIPIIAVTAHAMSGDREKALAAGCNEYVAKPIDEALLLNTLKRLIVP